MKKTILIVLLLAGLAGCAATVSQTDQSTPNSRSFSGSEIVADIAILSGGEWSGTLSYLDYSSGTKEEIPVSMRFEAVNENSMSYLIKYPGEAQHNAREAYYWSADGRSLNDAQIVSRSELEDEGIEIVTEGNGTDDGRSATIRTTYILTTHQFTVRKDVRFSTEGTFLNRNEYTLSR